MLLQTVAGIGPRVALATLAVLSPTHLNRALSTGDTAMLTRVPGIGRKGAERMIIELGDRVTPTTTGPATTSTSTGASAAVVGRGGGTDRGRAQVVEALVGLGFAAHHAEHAVTAGTAVTAKDTDTSDGAEQAPIDPGHTLRAALNHLGPAAEPAANTPPTPPPHSRPNALYRI